MNSVGSCGWRQLKIEVQLLKSWRDKTQSLQNENLMAQSNIQVLTEAKIELTNQIKKYQNAKKTDIEKGDESVKKLK